MRTSLTFHKILALLISLFMSSCTHPISEPMVGGACEYEVHQGTATVVGMEDGHVLARFKSDQPFKHTDWHSSLSKYYLRGVEKPQVGDTFPARLSIIYEGSCTPVNLYTLQKP